MANAYSFVQLPQIKKQFLLYISISYTTNTYHLTNFQVTASSSHLPIAVNLESYASHLFIYLLHIIYFVNQCIALQKLQVYPDYILITSCLLVPLPFILTVDVQISGPFPLRPNSPSSLPIGLFLVFQAQYQPLTLFLLPQLRFKSTCIHCDLNLKSIL